MPATATARTTAIGRPRAVYLVLLAIAIVAVSFSAPLVREAAGWAIERIRALVT
jgi:hypothetical protein